MKLLKHALLATVITVISAATALAHVTKPKPGSHSQGSKQATTTPASPATTGAATDADAAFVKVKCCFKFTWTGVKFKRPKTNCKSGFGFCLGTVTSCVICSTGTPDCSRCRVAASGDVPVSGTYDEATGKFTMELPSASVKGFFDPSEDLSVFGLDGNFQIFDQDTNALKVTLQSGEYAVVDDGTTMRIVFTAQ